MTYYFFQLFDRFNNEIIFSYIPYYLSDFSLRDWIFEEIKFYRLLKGCPVLGYFKIYKNDSCVLICDISIYDFI